MPRLIHLNGAPGVGKSTVARRWAAEHPGTLVLDIDLLRTLVGGWAADFTGAGALIRPVALAAITAYLAEGRDVVLPQLIARRTELARFRAAAEGADYRHLVLVAPPEELARRFHARPAGGPDDPTGAAARHVDENGGDALLRRYDADVRALASEDAGALLVQTGGGDVEATYAEVRAVVAHGDVLR